MDALALRRGTAAKAAVLVLGVLVPASHAPAADTEALWALLARGDHVALLRHARAPGMGDPYEFRLGDCATQRNLDASGREQARRIGAAFRAHGVARARVLSSEWCRCFETAELLGLGPVEPFPALNSYLDDPDRGPAQAKRVLGRLARHDGALPLVLVTHQINIGGLTGGTLTTSGDLLVARLTAGGRLEVVGTIPPPAVP